MYQVSTPPWIGMSRWMVSAILFAMSSTSMTRKTGLAVCQRSARDDSARITAARVISQVACSQNESRTINTIRSLCGSPARVFSGPFLTAEPPTKVPVERSRCFSACSFCRRNCARILAVFALTFGSRISGSGRSLSETFALDFDFAFALGTPFDFVFAALVARGDFRLGEAFDESAAALLARDAAGCRETAEERDADPLAEFADVDFLVAEPFLAGDFALPFDEDFRLRRRCVLVIASTSSSFRIPCHPEMP